MVNRPQSDVHRGISVGIADMSASASEQGLCRSVVLTDISALIEKKTLSIQEVRWRFLPTINDWVSSPRTL